MDQSVDNDKSEREVWKSKIEIKINDQNLSASIVNTC